MCVELNEQLSINKVYSWRIETASKKYSKIRSLQTRFWIGLLFVIKNRAWFESNDIVISVYSQIPFQKAKTFDTKGKTFSIRWFCILIERVMTVYGNYDVIAFKSCIQIFTVYTVYSDEINVENPNFRHI